MQLLVNILITKCYRNLQLSYLFNDFSTQVQCVLLDKRDFMHYYNCQNHAYLETQWNNKWKRAQPESVKWVCKLENVEDHESYFLLSKRMQKKKKKKKKKEPFWRPTTGKNEKSRLLTCLCHEIYRVETVGLNSSNYRPTLKITIFVNMWNLGQFHEILSISD